MELKLSADSLIDQMYDGVYFIDNNHRITVWNKAAERLTGFSADEVIGRECSDNILNHIDAEGNHLCSTACPLKSTISDFKHREAEVFLHHKDGHRIPVLVRTSPYIDEKGECLGGFELFTDISNFTEQEKRIKELEKLAMLDTLTEVANRYYLTQQLEASFDEMRRYKLPFGVLFFDIDHFKDFNDTYGHDVGDKVLKLVSRTIHRNLRPFDLFGRWGGEEFLAIIRNVTGSDLEEIGNRFRTLISNCFIMADNQKLEVTVSIGATICKSSDTPGVLQKRADELMYKSKEGGRNRVTLG